MREGWRCPACKRILGPHVDVCPCSEGGSAGVTVTPPSPLPASGGGGGSAAPTVVTGTTWPAGTTVTSGCAGGYAGQVFTWPEPMHGTEHPADGTWSPPVSQPAQAVGN